MDGIGQIWGRLRVCGNLTREGSVNLSDKVRADYDKAFGNGNPGSP